MKLLNIGFGNLLALEKIVCVLTPESAPVKRLIHLAKDKNILIDATCGRKTQSVFIMNSGHVVLSALTSEKILNKLEKEEVESFNYSN